MTGYNQLSSRFVETTARPGRHADGGGLYLHVDPERKGRSGAKRWVFVYHQHKRRRELGLGSFRKVGLADARQAAQQFRERLKKGLEPRAKASDQPKNFGEMADALIADRALSWRGTKTKARWERSLHHYAAPIRGKMLDAISTDDVVSILKPIWLSKPEMAQKTQASIEAVFDAGKAYGLFAGDNPARWAGHLKYRLGARKKLSRGHHRSVEVEELGTFLTDLRRRQGSAAKALEFLVLTAVRTSECLGAAWGEIDLERRVWNIPAERVKIAEYLKLAGFSVFRIYLSDQALRLLQEVRGPGTPHSSELIFPGLKGRLSDGALERVLDRMGVDATIHGFRSTFRRWGSRQFSETTDGRQVRRYSNDALEMSLSHVVGNATQRAYDREDYFLERKGLMTDWGSFLDHQPP